MNPRPRPSRRRPFLILPAFLGGALLLSCGDGGPSGPKEPVPGNAILTVSGSAPGDRAILLDIGEGATAVLGESPELEVYVHPGRQGFAVAVFGPLQGRDLLRISLPDRTVLPSVTLREVATEEGVLRENLSDYTPRLKLQRR